MQSVKLDCATPDDATAGDEEPLLGGDQSECDSASIPITRAQLRGNVECSIGQRVFGWVYDPNNSDYRFGLEAYIDNHLVGKGTADVFRDDLAEAEVGDGAHGFEIDIDDTYLTERTNVVSIVDTRDNLVIGETQVQGNYYARSSIATIEAAMVCGHVVLQENNDVESYAVELLVDGEVVATGDCNRTEVANRYAFSFALPEQVYDDNPHVYSVKLSGHLTDAKPYVDQQSSIITPSMYLAQDARNQQIVANSKIASSRYQGLRSGMVRIQQKPNSAPDMKSLIEAHDIVVQGHEGRRRFPKLVLPKYKDPIVSIVIPVYNQFPLTYHCIASLILHAGEIPFEVIVVDDCSDDETVEIESIVENVKLVRSDVNQRFLLSAEAGAAESSGEFVLFLNNDTEVTSGWLSALHDVFDRFDNVGLVGSKLIYPTGKLQEAGGIVWGNGKPWNIGNRQNAELPEHNYVRHADYVSGAAMMIRRSIWKKVGGFSKEFVPAYYEDTDLAFKVRDAGYKVVYCPASTVVHFEGMSNGRETNAGVKRFQSVNAPKFRQKWRHTFKNHGKEGVNLPGEMNRESDFRVLVVDYTTPRADFDAGGYALRQEIMLMQELGCSVTFVPNNMAHMGFYTTDLQDSGVECVYAPFYTSVGEYLEKHGQRFDMVYVVRYDVAAQVLPSVREFTHAKVVLNNADLHFLRELRAALVSDIGEISGPLATRDKELEVMRNVDAVLSYSEIEHAVIASHNLEEENIFKCPWILRSKRSTVPFAERKDIAFLGGFNHMPNREAVEAFAGNVMPLLAKLDPNIKLRVYGSNMPASIEALAADNVILEGYAESLSTVFDNCRIFVAPLLSGAGIKGKVLESIAHGVPSILSPIAAESTGLTHNTSALIAETDDEWVESILRLYRDQDLWEKIASETQCVLSDNFGFENGVRRFSELFEYLELDPSSSRNPVFSINAA